MALTMYPSHRFRAKRVVVPCTLALTGLFATALLLGLTRPGLANHPEHDPPSNGTEVGGADMTQERPKIAPTVAFNLAYNDYLSGRYDLAALGFQRFIQDFPWSSLTPTAHFWVGESYYNREDFEQAIPHFEYVIGAYPHHEMVPVALYRLSVATAETGDRVQSQTYRQRLINEFPTSNEAVLVKTWMAESG